MMNNILLTSAGQRVSLVRSFQKELAKTVLPGAVYTADMSPEYSAACNVSDGYFKVLRVSDEGYIDGLINLCLKHHIRMVVPTIDTELQVLADHKHLFEKEHINVIVSSSDFIRTCRDKRITNTFFLANGIDIPKAIDKNNPTFPLFIKPYDGSLSSNIFILRDVNELTDYHLNNEKFLFMELIDKGRYDEYTVDMYYGLDHRVKCIVPRKRLAIRAGEILKGITSKNGIVGFLKERLDTIDGAVGCITLQVFHAEATNHIIGIEINPRFGGGYPLSYAAGANYPGWLIKEYIQNEPVTYIDSWEDQLLMLRYDDEILLHGHSAK